MTVSERTCYEDPKTEKKSKKNPIKRYGVLYGVLTFASGSGQRYRIPEYQ